MFDESDFSMTRRQPSEELMIRYLLDELSEAERGEFERLCFDDDQVFEELMAVEAELTDDYVCGELEGRRREQFERRVLRSPARRGDLELARLITGHRAAGHDASEPGTPTAARGRPSKWQAFLALLGPHRRAWQLSFAAVFIVAIAVGVWMLWTRSQTGEIASVRPHAGMTPQVASPPPTGREAQNSPPATAPSEDKSGSANVGATQQTSSNNGASASRAPQNRGRQTPAPPRGFVPTFALVAGFERGEGGVNELKIPRGVDRVRLKIDLAGAEGQNLSATLRRVEGQQIFTWGDLKALPTKSGRALTLELPAATLSAGDYLLTLSGSGAQGRETIASYFLRVERR